MMAKKKKSTTTPSSCYLYGHHTVCAALDNPKRRHYTLYLQPSHQSEYQPLLAKYPKLNTKPLDKNILDQLPPYAVHQGVVLHTAILPERHLKEKAITALLEQRTATILLLDQLTDPHNVGAILRSCCAFDIDLVIVTKHHSIIDSPIVAKAASGALEHVPIVQVSNLVQAMQTLKLHHFWCIGLDAHSKLTLPEYDLPKKAAIILGAEGKGLRHLTKQHCDDTIKLPMSPQQESLNVSNAAAIIGYQLYLHKHPH